VPVLRHELQFRVVGRLGAGLVRALHATWRVRVLDPSGIRSGIRRGKRQAIVAFWHRHLLTMLAHHRGFKVCVPVSEHRDGEYAAQVMARFGLASVRGSTTRGSINLLKGLLRAIEEGWSLGITPDGPRGPAFSVQPGFALLARRSGLPVHPVGVAADHPVVLSSWDRFAIPKPFSRVVIAFGPPLDPGDFGDPAALCPVLERRLQETTARAWSALGPKP
jgi:lysophospholipid acyltransferase (LPLAT)-like uncharacterized protein